jgi:hypothetical protein
MQKCIDCLPETLDDILAANGIDKPKKVIEKGYKFQLNGKTWTVSKVSGETVFARYSSCSCSEKRFPLNQLL